MTGRQSLTATLRRAASATALIALGGCTSLGGNVKGNFSCRAPDGICAPSSSIDDRALAMIAGENGTTGVMPAGPVADPQARARTSRTAAVGSRVPIGQGDPHRTQERVLRIVFQPYVDEFGRLHEASAVHAVVAGGAWQQQLLASSTPIPDLSARARPVATASLADAVNRADGSGADLSAIDPDLPDPAAVAAARARAPVVDPVAAIRNEVAARLTPKAGRTPRRAVFRFIPQSLPPSAGGAPATTATVSKGAKQVGATMKAMTPDATGATGAAPNAKSKSAQEATARVKATIDVQAAAQAAQDAARDATSAGAPPTTKPTVKAPVRAAGFPGAVPGED